MKVTSQSDAGRLLRVAMKHPREAFVSQDSIDGQWNRLNFLAAPDFLRSCNEFDSLIRLLEDRGTQVELLPADPRTGLDSIYTRDATFVTDRGVVLCSMGKALRSGEPAAQRDAIVSMGLPIIGAIAPPGILEGGDLTWLDERTIVAGHGYRTNAEGLRQLRTLLGDAIDEMIVVPLPHWRGVTDVMHVMSLISPVDSTLAVVYSALLPVPFRTTLRERGFRLIEVPDEEFESMGANVLTIAPRTVVALKGNPRTRALLEAAGVEVIEYDGQDISVKGAGGPTCLTRPLARSV